ncbi:MAG: hypothetical protein IJ856_02370 [Candidatus Methanomethylophilaceae archaeon]|nr:hypothetical protein [Candidatus Methanomethylophilaceae archaeon]
MSDEIRVEIWRPKFFFMCKNTPKVLVDGKQVGKVKDGETLEFTTTPGVHEISLKALAAVPSKATFDLRDGDVLIIDNNMVTWFLRRKEERDKRP